MVLVKNFLDFSPNITYHCIIGADEMADDSVSIKNLADGSQVKVSRNEVVKYILGNRD